MGLFVLRMVMIVAGLLLSAGEVLAHGSESATPPPPKKGPSVSPAQVSQTGRGLVLADPKGMTLYYFDRDDSGNKSTCDGKCAERWLPFAAPADAEATGDFTLIVRTDGSKMWAYRYRPLYYSPRDKDPGDTNGFDSSNLWHIARPAQ
jgi:predicted lipoprotein with Yx(FWY)xxD motif